MQKKTTSRWAAVSTVLFFLALLLWGAVANSDFPLGIYGPPEGNHLPNWADFGDLNANRSFNYNLAYYNTLSQYLDSVDAQSMKAVLRLYGGCGYPWNDRDFLMEYYSQGQRWVYEVEQRYSDAEYMLNTQTQRNPDGFYHFSHKDDGEQDDRGEIDPNAPTGGASWVCFKNSDTDGVMLIGPRETVNDEDALGGFRAQTGYPRWASPDTLYPFQSIIHLRADTTQCSTQQDSVFRLEVIQKRRTYSGSSYQYFTIFDSVFTPETIGTNDWTEIDSLFYSVFDHSKYNHGSTWVYYKLTWYDNCDFWVDYIEFMDMERGKYLFTSDAIRTEKTDSIVFQCDSIENAHPGIIVDWKQSDEPFRSTFLAHGVVNDSVRNVISAGTTSPLYLSNWNDNPYFYKSDLFVKHAKPPTLEVDFYVFVGDTTKYGGKQGELDTLASYIEASYQACQITPDSSLDLHFTAQAFAYWDSSDLAYDWRHPTRGEIFAEVFIALAHGAKGINFFKYTSYAPSGGDSSLGLVDYNYSHTNPPFSDRWQAVHNIFTQIDTMETTLLALERDTAFCVYGTSNAFKSPLSDVYFEDDDDDYIEVGQFHDSSDVDYLIIVNRRTDYDRHITIETDLTGSNALLDLYTQERFVSSTGDFKSIPFDSGEGRVFKIEEGFNDWVWTNDEYYVLADTVTNTSSTPNTIMINNGPADNSNTIIKATEAGLLWFTSDQTLDCNGSSADSIIFTALEPDQGWKGIYLTSRNSGTKDTLQYVRLDYADDPALKITGGRDVLITNSIIDTCGGTGIACYSSDLTMSETEVTRCHTKGLLLDNSDARVYDCTFEDNASYNAWIVSGSTPKIGDNQFNSSTIGIYTRNEGTVVQSCETGANPNCGSNSITGNGVGVYVDDTSTVYLGIDINRKGKNDIYSNSQQEVYNNTNETVLAQYNYWGATGSFYGLVDTANAYYSPSPESIGGWNQPIVQNQPPAHGLDEGGIGPDLTEAYRLRSVGIDLFLEGEYYTAIDTFQFIIDDYPGTSPARFAFNHIVVCYREMDDFEGAVDYIDAFLSQPPDASLVGLAYYHKVLNLARLQEYQNVVNIAVSPQITANLDQNLLEAVLIELGMSQKYGLDNVAIGDSVFSEFLQDYPESPLASIAAMELGVAWEPPEINSQSAAMLNIPPNLPKVFALHQNYPNPFNPNTTIRYDLPEISDVTIRVFNIMGRQVATLVDQVEDAGYKQILWDGRNKFGGELSSGMYILHFKAVGQGGKHFTRAQKMLMIK